MATQTQRIALFTWLIALVSGQTIGKTGWDNLETTFGGFLPVPLTQSAANDAKWIPVMRCGESGSPGNVYSDNGDLSSMPFYNADGNLAGIILGMLNPGKSSETKPFVRYSLANGTVFWGIEANFRNPYEVCSKGSSNDAKVGDRLWFADGSHSSYYKAPLNESTNALTADGYIYGQCFSYMGYHWWRYIAADMDCNDSYPIFLLYNKGKLNAWGVAMSHDDRPNLTSFRWEHPEGTQLQAFFQPTSFPKCLTTQGTLLTQHIFLTNPENDLCPSHAH